MPFFRLSSCHGGGQGGPLIAAFLKMFQLLCCSKHMGKNDQSNIDKNRKTVPCTIDSIKSGLWGIWHQSSQKCLAPAVIRSPESRIIADYTAACAASLHGSSRKRCQIRFQTNTAEGRSFDIWTVFPSHCFDIWVEQVGCLRRSKLQRRCLEHTESDENTWVDW